MQYVNLRLAHARSEQLREEAHRSRGSQPIRSKRLRRRVGKRLIVWGEKLAHEPRVA
jgi:hypothetical protein